MSRSRKKNPIVKDNVKGMKTCANRKVRRHINRGVCIANGNAYRKLTCSYDIRDWSCRYTYAEYSMLKESYRKEYENGVCQPPFGTVRDLSAGMNYWDWYKMHIRK